MSHYPRVAAAVLACAAAACNPLNRGQRAAGSGPATIVFQNQSLYEAAVYAIPRGGAQRRIGTVQSGRTDTLTVSGGEIVGGGSLALVARLLADPRTPSTGPISLLPGDWIQVTLPPTANTLAVVPITR